VRRFDIFAGMSLSERLRYDAAVIGDYALRTLLSSAVTGAMFPGGLLLDSRAEVRQMERYAALAERQDAAAVFEPPPPRIPIRTLPGRGLADRGGHVELLRFHSPHEPLHAGMRRAYLRHARNATARAQHWRHDDEVRETLIVIHGFGASPAAFNSAFFSLPSFFSAGWDVMLFTVPFHGGRGSARSPFNGAELFSHGLNHFAEAMLQAVCDLRVLLDYLERLGAPRFGVTGLSLGGYVTALLAEVDQRLDFAIPNAAVTSIPALMSSWFPTNIGAWLLERVKRVPRELIERSCAVHGPLNYPPAIRRERLMVIGGLGDRLAPPEQSEWLWQHWGRPELHWFRGSHVLHFERAVYLRAMRELMGPLAAEPAGADPARPPRPARQQHM
jgi:pimeloyl-ACP methyl ester carboxylesterase